jgi:hypothetical protein
MSLLLLPVQVQLLLLLELLQLLLQLLVVLQELVQSGCRHAHQTAWWKSYAALRPRANTCRCSGCSSSSSSMSSSASTTGAIPHLLHLHGEYSPSQS